MAETNVCCVSAWRLKLSDVNILYFLGVDMMEGPSDEKQMGGLSVKMAQREKCGVTEATEEEDAGGDMERNNLSPRASAPLSALQSLCSHSIPAVTRGGGGRGDAVVTVTG